MKQIMVACAYFATAKLGLLITIEHTNVSPVWPATGIGLAAVILFGYRIWPAIALGGFCATAGTLAGLGYSVPLAALGAFGTALGNVLEAVIAVFLIRRLIGDRNPFGRAEDYVRFLLCGVLLATGVSATIGSGMVGILRGIGDDFGRIWLTWWLGDAAGALIVTPVFLTWEYRLKSGWTPLKNAERLTVFLILCLFVWLVFFENHDLQFLFIPLLVWAAVRFGRFETAGLVLLLSILLIAGTLAGFSMFTGVTRTGSLLLMQGYIGVVSITTMLLSFMRADLERLLNEQMATNRRLEQEIADHLRDEESLRRQRLLLEAEIAERKAAQERLAFGQRQVEELNRSLEERIDAAITDLRRRDQILIQQSRMAAIGEMIRNLSHQWRQPLNNIGLIVQNLRLSLKFGRLDGAEIDDDVTAVMGIIGQMSGAIDDLRNFYHQDIEKASFVVNREVERVLDFVSALFRHRNIRIELAAGETVTAFGYRNEYSQVLFNILTNAREVLAERQVADPRIFVGISGERGRSVVTIRDNGGGIDEEILPRVFDPYFTTKEPGKGTGIGLYMSKVIIERNMGGGLTVANREGGAEFRIEV